MSQCTEVDPALKTRSGLEGASSPFQSGIKLPDPTGQGFLYLDNDFFPGDIQ
jgi:hypothetical protein